VDPLAVPRLTVPDGRCRRTGSAAALNTGDWVPFHGGPRETDSLEWTLESVHFPDPVTRWSAALSRRRDGRHRAAHGRARILLDGIAFRELTGGSTPHRTVRRAARKPLPRWLLPIVSRTSTTLRQRLAAPTPPT
jgi:hypothetical protein